MFPLSWSFYCLWLAMADGCFSKSHQSRTGHGSDSSASKGSKEYPSFGVLHLLYMFSWLLGLLLEPNSQIPEKLFEQKIFISALSTSMYILIDCIIMSHVLMRHLITRSKIHYASLKSNKHTLLPWPHQ